MPGSGTTGALLWLGGFPAKLGSERSVPYWNLTPETSLSENPVGSPLSSNSTELSISAFAPVTAALPPPAYPAEAIPYCRPSTPTGPCRLVPGKLLDDAKRPRPVLLIPCLAPPGPPARPALYAHSPPTPPPGSVPVPDTGNNTVLPFVSTAAVRPSVGSPEMLKNTAVNTSDGAKVSALEVLASVTSKFVPDVSNVTAALRFDPVIALVFDPVNVMGIAPTGAASNAKPTVASAIFMLCFKMPPLFVLSEDAHARQETRHDATPKRDTARVAASGPCVALLSHYWRGPRSDFPKGEAPRGLEHRRLC